MRPSALLIQNVPVSSTALLDNPHLKALECNTDSGWRQALANRALYRIPKLNHFVHTGWMCLSKYHAAVNGATVEDEAVA